MGEGDEGNNKFDILANTTGIGSFGHFVFVFFCLFQMQPHMSICQRSDAHTFFFTVFCCLRLFICLFVCLCHCHYHCQMLDVAFYWQALISCASMGINKSESTAFLLQKCKQKQWRIQDQVSW